MEQIDLNSSRPKKLLRFNDNVEHRQTFGKLDAEGNYQVVLKEMTIKLVDEDDDEFFTVQELKEMEKELKDILARQEGGQEIPQEDLVIVRRAQSFFARMEKLFDGSDELSTFLPKGGPKSMERQFRHNSANVITRTEGQSSVKKFYNTSSWEVDPEFKRSLDLLHSYAIMHFSKIKQFPTKKELKKKMMELRPMDQTVTFTVDELCSLYLDWCKAKERLIFEDEKKRMLSAATIGERQAEWLRYHTSNWIPHYPGINEPDQEHLKMHLGSALDIFFEDKTLDAKYSSISKNDIKHYLHKKYG